MYGFQNRHASHRWRPVVGAALGLALVISAGAARSVQAQATGVIRGTVTEAGTQRPLPGAQVHVRGTQRGAIADARGTYQISGVSPESPGS